jgi:hypothetical protein
MTPASRHHARVKPLTSQAKEKVPNPSRPLEIMLGSYKHSFTLFQACVKMKPILSLVFILSRDRKYMRIGYQA